MPSQSLAELHEQGRHNYIYWPLWLALKRKQVELLLLQTHAEIKLLHAVALPLPADITAFTVPLPQTVTGTAFHFESRTAGNQTVLTCHRKSDMGQPEFCNILRVTSANAWYIDHAALQLNMALKSHPAATVFNAARLWVSFHGQGLPEILWQISPDKKSAVDTSWE